MKRITKCLLMSLVLSLMLAVTCQASVKKVTITSPTKSSTYTVYRTTKNVTKTIKASVTVTSKKDKKTLKYTSSNPKVVSIDSKGKFTCKKAGTATITVASKQTPSKKDTLKIKVVQRVTKLAAKTTTGYAIGSSLTISKGKSVGVSILATPSDASNKVTWKSSNAKIAKVSSNGKITAVKTGTAKITATAKDGSKKSVSFKVKVVTGKVTGISLDKKSVTLVKGKTATVKATVKTSGSGANKTVVWSSSKNSVATVNNGKIKAVKKGSATITVQSIDGTNKKATVSVKVIDKPTEPTTDPTKPSEDPTKPSSEDPTKPSENPTKPSEDPTKPSEDPTKPSEDPTKPSEDPTKPSEDPTKPSEDPTKPSEDPTKPSEDPTKPSEDPTKPSEDPTKPSEDPTKPSEDPTKPSEDPTKPSEDPTEPSTEEPTEPVTVVKTVSINTDKVTEGVVIKGTNSVKWDDEDKAISTANKLTKDTEEAVKEIAGSWGIKVDTKLKGMNLIINGSQYTMEFQNDEWKLYNTAGKEVSIKEKLFSTPIKDMKIEKQLTETQVKANLARIYVGKDLVDGTYDFGTGTVKIGEKEYKISKCMIEKSQLYLTVDGENITVEMTGKNEITVTGGESLNGIISSVKSVLGDAITVK